TQIEPGVHAPRRSFIRAGERKRREGTVGIHQQVQRLRDICALVIAAIEHVTAKLQAGILTEQFALPRQKLQPPDIHKVVVVVNGDIASISVEDAGVIRQQILLIGPNVRERLAPDLHADLPLRRDSPRRQTALDYDQGRIWSKLLQSE